MPDHFVVSSPTTNSAFLDQVVKGALGNKDLVGQLARLAGDVKQDLLSQNAVTARKAAEVLVTTYFGIDFK